MVGVFDGETEVDRFTLTNHAYAETVARTIVVDDVSGRFPVTIQEPVERSLFKGTRAGGTGYTMRVVEARDGHGNLLAGT